MVRAENDELKAEKRALVAEMAKKNARIRDKTLAACKQENAYKDERNATEDVSLTKANASETPKRTKRPKVTKPRQQNANCVIYLASEERPPPPTPAKKVTPFDRCNASRRQVLQLSEIRTQVHGLHAKAHHLPSGLWKLAAPIVQIAARVNYPSEATNGPILSCNGCYVVDPSLLWSPMASP